LAEDVVEVTELTRLQTPSSNFVLSPACDHFDFEGSFVPFIDFSDIEVGDLLGTGRNGDVFETTCNGESVAVKQFDITKNSEAYENEVKAYKYLKSSWGVLVPIPKFVSTSPSGNVRYLGMTKGRLPDRDISDELHEVLDALRSTCGFDHLDSSHGRNCILVSKEDRSGESVLVIDLENWQKVLIV
jgi:hypothetical protein